MKAAAQLHDAMKSFGLTGELRTAEDVDDAFKAFAEKVGIVYDETTTFADLLNAYERYKTLN